MIIALACNVISCSKQEVKTEVKFSLIDDVGDTIGFKKHPSKIVSLAPNITEALFAIGADSLIVAVTDLCDYPESAKRKIKTGSYLNPDLEKIISMKPDIIFMNVESKSQTTYQSLKKLGQNIFVSNAKDFSGIMNMINDLGKITGLELSSKRIADSLIELRNNYNRVDSGKTKLKTLIVVSIKPFMTANGKTFVSEIAELAGLENIYKDESIDYPLIGTEDLILRIPALILLPADTTETERNNNNVRMLQRLLNPLPASRNNRTFLIDDDIMFRPGPRVLEGVKIIKDKLDNLNSSR